MANKKRTKMAPPPWDLDEEPITPKRVSPGRRFSRPLVLVVEPSMDDEIRKIAKLEKRTVASVARELIEAGLKHRRKGGGAAKKKATKKATKKVSRTRVTKKSASKKKTTAARRVVSRGKRTT